MKKNIMSAITIFCVITAMLIPSAVMAKNVDKYISQLPTSGFRATAPMQVPRIETSDLKGNFVGYDFYNDDGFVTASSNIKNDIKAKTKSLCVGKKNDYEKAFAISTFVHDHMTYLYAEYHLTAAWKYGQGNCETYAVLTAAMLYYAGIPNGYAYTEDHIFNVALCDGRWVPMDSQVSFDGPADFYDYVEMIAIKSGKMVYVVDDLKDGIKLAQVGNEAYEADKVIQKKGVTIPSWVKGYYTDSWLGSYPKMVIRGTKGDAVERLVNEYGFRKVTYKGKKFIARKNASVKVQTPKTVVKSGNGKFTVKYKKLKKTSGIQIGYKKTGKGIYKFKRFSNGKSLKKEIKNLAAGKYIVKVRAYKKSGSTYHYSKWTKQSKVNVR